jgi:predicted GH43/DUF377 family glycosyl hydrolase
MVSQTSLSVAADSPAAANCGLYYGAADSSICLARADLAGVIDLVNAESTG